MRLLCRLRRSGTRGGTGEGEAQEFAAHCPNHGVPAEWRDQVAAAAVTAAAAATAVDAACCRCRLELQEGGQRQWTCRNRDGAAAAAAAVQVQQGQSVPGRGRRYGRQSMEARQASKEGSLQSWAHCSICLQARSVLWKKLGEALALSLAATDLWQFMP